MNCNLVFEKSFGGPSALARFLSVDLGNDGSIFATGIAYGSSSASRVIKNLMVNVSTQTGNLIWEKKWSTAVDSSMVYGYNITKAPDVSLYNGGM